jgi:hypothetical protein
VTVMTDYKKAVLLDKVIQMIKEEPKANYPEGSQESAEHRLKAYDDIVEMLRNGGALRK